MASIIICKLVRLWTCMLMITMVVMFIYNLEGNVYFILDKLISPGQWFINQRPPSRRFLQELFQVTKDSTPLSEKPVCIEGNICKLHYQDTYYVYKRLPDFLKRVDESSSNISLNTALVPNIVHFVQYTDFIARRTKNEFKFHHMVSVLAAYRIQKPDRIYFWMDQEPKSLYWTKLKSLVPMYLIKRERPKSIRGRSIHFVTKVSNVIRLEAVLEYGGMYFDLDVIVVKPMDPLRTFDTTMGKETETQFCNAVIISKPWAPFLRKWHQAYINHNELNWAYHSGKVPYLLSQKFPSSIHIEETSFFRPGLNDLDDLFKEGHLYDWRRKSYCVHLWIRLYKGRDITDFEIDSWKTTVGEIYRYVLYGDWHVKHRNSSFSR